MTKVCLTPNGSYEFCKDVQCTESGCGVYEYREVCEKVCGNICKNGQYSVCISTSDASCVATDAAYMRFGSFACTSRVFPLWATALIAVVVVGIILVLVFCFMRRVRTSGFYNRLYHAEPAKYGAAENVLYTSIFEYGGRVPPTNESMQADDVKVAER